LGGCSHGGAKIYRVRLLGGAHNTATSTRRCVAGERSLAVSEQAPRRAARALWLALWPHMSALWLPESGPPRWLVGPKRTGPGPGAQFSFLFFFFSLCISFFHFNFFVAQSCITSLTMSATFHESQHGMHIYFVYIFVSSQCDPML
jgi:hypothetical protein